MSPRLVLLARIALLCSLAACGDPSAPPEEPEDIAGSEAGNPPVADTDVACADSKRCRANAERFVDALREPWTPAPLQAACVDRRTSTECECIPQGVEADSSTFTWPELVAREHARSPERGCLVWSRIATVVSSLRDDPAECLVPLPGPAACELGACIETCRAVQEAREVDSRRRFDARLRSTHCSRRGCLASFELEGDCYVKTNEQDVTSNGPFDCELSDEALFERARAR